MARAITYISGCYNGDSPRIFWPFVFFHTFLYGVPMSIGYLEQLNSSFLVALHPLLNAKRHLFIFHIQLNTIFQQSIQKQWDIMNFFLQGKIGKEFLLFLLDFPQNRDILSGDSVHSPWCFDVYFTAYDMDFYTYFRSLKNKAFHTFPSLQSLIFRIEYNWLVVCYLKFVFLLLRLWRIFFTIFPVVRNIYPMTAALLFLFASLFL